MNKKEQLSYFFSSLRWSPTRLTVAGVPLSGFRLETPHCQTFFSLTATVCCGVLALVSSHLNYKGDSPESGLSGYNWSRFVSSADAHWLELNVNF